MGMLTFENMSKMYSVSVLFCLDPTSVRVQDPGVQRTPMKAVSIITLMQLTLLGTVGFTNFAACSNNWCRLLLSTSAHASILVSSVFLSDDLTKASPSRASVAASISAAGVDCTERHDLCDIQSRSWNKLSLKILENNLLYSGVWLACENAMVPNTASRSWQE